MQTVTGQKYYGVRAYSLLYRFQFTFDVTNPNQFDMRIIRFYLDVIKFIDTAIIGVWENGLGGGMPVREFGCEIEPCVGRYDCFQVSEGFDYVRLSSGEMEAFLITVGVVKEGIYHLRLGMEYSIGGETRKIEVDDDILEERSRLCMDRPGGLCKPLGGAWEAIPARSVMRASQTGL